MSAVLKIGPVIRKYKASNRFCGPAALSALTGFDTRETSKIIRAVNQRKQVTGTSSTELLRSFEACGVFANRILHCSSPAIADTLISYVRNRKPETPHPILIVYSNHWAVLQGDKYVCGLTEQVTDLDHPSVKRRGKITEAYIMTSPNGVKFPKEIVVQAAPWTKYEIGIGTESGDIYLDGYGTDFVEAIRDFFEIEKEHDPWFKVWRYSSNPDRDGDQAYCGVEGWDNFNPPEPIKSALIRAMQLKAAE